MGLPFGLFLMVITRPSAPLNKRFVTSLDGIAAFSSMNMSVSYGHILKLIVSSDVE